MLQQACAYIHNFFIAEPHAGTWTIAGGAISLPFLLDGQRFWVTGSMLNDGVYTYHGNTITDDDNENFATLFDETFDGTICAMAVPRDFAALCCEMKAWQDKNGEAVSGPYTSENVSGVYSYTKATNADGTIATVFDVFGGRLNQWRKTCL